MTVLAVHVIANGDLFREAFNAIVTLLGTSTFNTAFRISVLFAVIGAGFSYIKRQDIVILAKWFIVYFAVTIILLGPKITVEIVDSSNPGAVYAVDNVSFGLGFPASLITSISYGLENAMERAFHMPDDAAYSKTGMLFGSKIFKLSTGFHLVDARVKKHMNEYIKNCVIGDVVINKKYTMQELLDSTDIWSTITVSPSPVRGMFLSNGEFKTCKEATPILHQDITDDITNKGFTFFGKRIFGGRDPASAAFKLKLLLEKSYNYYSDLSKSAKDIMIQNVMINAVREGIVNYSAEAGATASLLNLSSTSSMTRMRMAFGISRNLATYFLPIMQVDILLLMLCLFPIIMLLSIQPVCGINVFKHYVYSLIWVESWPILFSCLNLAVTFYVHNKTSGLAKGGLTISNSNLLALEHSDVANMAGYLMTCIPFIAIGVVKGMSSAFNNAAGYIGGMMHSTASAAATEAVTGNISLGNMSYGNVNANKFDTNRTHMHGMSTEQLANGATVTHAADGSDVYNVAPGMSHLATNVNASSIMTESLTKQAESARSAAMQEQAAFKQSLSNAVSQMDNFSKSESLGLGLGTNYVLGQSDTASSSASHLYGMGRNIAERDNVNFGDSFTGRTSFSQDVKGSLGAGIKFPISGAISGSLSGSINAGLSHSRTSTTTADHNVGTSINLNNEEADRFNTNMNELQRFDLTNNAETKSSNNAAALSQVSASLQEADTHYRNYSNNLAKSERLSKTASYVEQHSAQINSNFNQGFASYVQHECPDRAEYLLANTANPRAIAELNVLASRYMSSSGFVQEMTASYERNSADIHPEKMYNKGSENLAAREAEIRAKHEHQAQDIRSRAEDAGVALDKKRYEELKRRVTSAQHSLNSNITKKGTDVMNNNKKANAKAKDKIKVGTNKAEKSGMNFWSSIKPKDIKE